MAAYKSSTPKISSWLAKAETPVDVRQYAALRISFGFLAAWFFLERMPFVWLYLSSGTWLGEAVFKEGFNTVVHLPIVFQYWPSLLGLFVLFICSSVCWMLGLWTRTTGILTWVGLVVVENQNPMMGFPGSELLRLMVLPLLFIPAGGQWSLDAWFYRYQRRDVASPVPLVLLRIQVVMVFVLSGYSKFQSQYWLEGDALVYLLMNPTISRLSPVTVAEFSWFFFPLSSLASRFWMIFETLFPILILFPLLRRPVLNIASILILISLLLMKLSWLPLGQLSLLIAFFQLSEIRQIEASVVHLAELRHFKVWRSIQIFNPLYMLRSWGMRYEIYSEKMQERLVKPKDPDGF